MIEKCQRGMLAAFHAALVQHDMTPDAAQLAAAQRLQKLYDDLLMFKAARGSRLRRLLMPPALPKGVWLWGGVGRGKSFLMDCFFNAVPYRRKRRVHFHAFMREVHQALKTHHDESDPLAKVAGDIARKTRLMCFDEFHVSDIADAMILGRLMQALFDAGVVFCITSNYPPDGLYPNGLQRENFLPAIHLLNDRLDVMEIDAGIDYRLRALKPADIYLSPWDAQAEKSMRKLFRQLTGGDGQSATLELLGRKVPAVRVADGVVWFDFATLCGGPRSQNDYLALAENYHTVFLSNVPKMGQDMANQARRFTWLVDIFYDYHVKLILGAACAVEFLYTQGVQANEFRRTVSRLVEMGSHEYLASTYRKPAAPEKMIES
jgi:cell division protein ZapE